MIQQRMLESFLCKLGNKKSLITNIMKRLTKFETVEVSTPVFILVLESRLLIITGINLLLVFITVT